MLIYTARSRAHKHKMKLETSVADPWHFGVDPDSFSSYYFLKAQKHADSDPDP
jgi:hypothetical protein